MSIGDGNANRDGLTHVIPIFVHVTRFEEHAAEVDVQERTRRL